MLSLLECENEMMTMPTFSPSVEKTFQLNLQLQTMDIRIGRNSPTKPRSLLVKLKTEEAASGFLHVARCKRRTRRQHESREARESPDDDDMVKQSTATGTTIDTARVVGGTVSTVSTAAKIDTADDIRMDTDNTVQTLHSISAEVKDVIGHTISGSGEDGMPGGTAPRTPTPSPLFLSV